MNVLNLSLKGFYLLLTEVINEGTSYTIHMYKIDLIYNGETVARGSEPGHNKSTQYIL